MKNFYISIASLFVLFVNKATTMVLPLSVCEASPNTRHIREPFSSISYLVQSEDKHNNLRIMEKVLLEDITLSERCCFLHHMLYFYMENVFNNYFPLDLKHRNTISHLANAFFILSQELQPCHHLNICKCNDKTSNKIEKIMQNFRKLDTDSAVLKAVGELDLLLQWMEKL